jgi:hypothetical protein
LNKDKKYLRPADKGVNLHFKNFLGRVAKEDKPLASMTTIFERIAPCGEALGFKQNIGKRIVAEYHHGAC